MPRLLLALIIAIPLAFPAPAPATAQTAGLTLDQVKRKYRKMNEVHILKCDRDGDLTFTRTEMLCVSSIYQVMYLDQN
jgi:hypothetical protein